MPNQILFRRNRPAAKLLFAWLFILSNPAFTQWAQAQTTAGDKGNGTLAEADLAASKKSALLKKSFDWLPILENPETRIPELFAAKNWQKIRTLIEADIDVRFNELLAQKLFDGAATGPKRDLQVLMIEKLNADGMLYLAKNVFSQSRSVEMNDLLKLLIQKGNQAVLNELAIYTFSQPHTAEMKDLIKSLISKGDATVLRALAVFVFSKPHAAGMKDLILQAIQKADMSVLRHLAAFTFSQAHTAGMTDLLRLVIEKGDATVMKELSTNTLLRPHLAQMKDLKDAVTLADQATRKKFLLAKLGPAKVTLKEPKAPEAISANLKEGDIVLVRDQKLKIIKKAGEGLHAVVYQAREVQTRAVFALKVALDSSPENLDSIAEESKKATRWYVAGATHSEILVQEKDFVLKKWVEARSNLESPDVKIPELFKNQNTEAIRDLIIANVDAEINEEIAKKLFEGPATGVRKELQILMIQKSEMALLQYLAENVFSKPQTAKMTDLLRLVIERGDRSVLAKLSANTFSQPHTAHMTELLRLVIQKGDANVLTNLAVYTFSKPHTAGMKELMELMILKGNSSVLRHMVGFTFSQPHAAGMTDLLRLIVEKADAEVLKELSSKFFASAQTGEMKELKSALWIEDREARKQFLLQKLGPAKSSLTTCSGLFL